MSRTRLEIRNWGLVDYAEALERQQALQGRRIDGRARDTLILVEHPPVVTLGLRGGEADLRCSASRIGDSGVALHQINRGGFATAHEPGQLVAYPVVLLKKKDLRWFSRAFLQALADTLADFGLVGEFRDGEPGVWVESRKIASFGIAVKKWVSSHGIALNVNNELSTFELIIPCGKPSERVTSMRRELGRPVAMEEVADRFCRHFCRRFDYYPDVVESALGITS